MHEARKEEKKAEKEGAQEQEAKEEEVREAEEEERWGMSDEEKWRIAEEEAKKIVEVKKDDRPRSEKVWQELEIIPDQAIKVYASWAEAAHNRMQPFLSPPGLASPAAAAPRAPKPGTALEIKRHLDAIRWEQRQTRNKTQQVAGGRPKPRKQMGFEGLRAAINKSTHNFLDMTKDANKQLEAPAQLHRSLIVRAPEGRDVTPQLTLPTQRKCPQDWKPQQRKSAPVATALPVDFKPLVEAPLSAASIAAAPPGLQKQMIGEKLFPLISRIQPELAGKITGMLLELDNPDLLILLESESLLQNKVKEGVQSLKEDIDHVNFREWRQRQREFMIKSTSAQAGFRQRNEDKRKGEATAQISGGGARADCSPAPPPRGLPRDPPDTGKGSRSPIKRRWRPISNTL